MTLNDLLKAGCLSALALTMVACSSSSSTDSTTQVDEPIGAQQGEQALQTEGGSVELVGVIDPVMSAEEQERQRLEQERQQQEALRQDSQIVYFEFDRSDITGQYIEILEAHAAYLLDNPTQSVLVEGHTDERGTPEYNIALGERRAKAVARHLQSLGVLASQISTVSYGEEKALDGGHDEAAWAKNRRAVLVY